MKTLLEALTESRKLGQSEFFLIMRIALNANGDGRFIADLSDLADRCSWNWGKTRAVLIRLRDQKKLIDVSASDRLGERPLTGPLTALDMVIQGQINLDKVL